MADLQQSLNSTAVDLGEDDLKLTHALQIGPRLPWTTLGEILDSHPTSLAARWQRLEASRRVWVTAHPLGRPDQMSLSFHDVRCTPGRRQEVADALASIPDVVTVEECRRDHDLKLTVITPGPAELTDHLYPHLDAVQGLERYETAFGTHLHLNGADWTLNALTVAQQQALKQAASATSAPPSAGPPSGVSFGPILRVLSRDGRATAATIAKETGLHPATARRRLHRVLDSGVLSFRCDVSHRAVGYPLICQWSARLPASQHQSAAQLLKSLGALRLCASTTGRSNFTFMLWLRSAAEIMTVEHALETRFPDLDLHESVIISRILKRMGWRLTATGERTGEFTPPGPVWD